MSISIQFECDVEGCTAVTEMSGMSSLREAYLFFFGKGWRVSTREHEMYCQDCALGRRKRVDTL